VKATATIAPPVHRPVTITLSEEQAHKLRSILGNSNCGVHGLRDLFEALKEIFPCQVPAYESADWAIRRPDGSIA